ncbi:MAG: hypothetical protein AABY22_23265 [Nanoarchaeota archaeon]
MAKKLIILATALFSIILILTFSQAGIIDEIIDAGKDIENGGFYV